MIRVLAFILVAVILFLIYKGALLLLKKDVQEGIQRLAYAISGLWIGIPFLVIWAQNRWNLNSIDQDEWMAWFLLALLPNIVFWVLIWVLKGFRKDEDNAA